MATISRIRVIEITGREEDSSREGRDSRLGNCSLVRFLVSVSVALLLFSALGPGLDHHFAERTPHHSHAVIGHDDGHLNLDHQHQFDSLHVHYNPNNSIVGGGQEGQFFGPTRVMYLTPDEGLAQINAPMALSTDQSLWIFPDLPSGLHKFALIGENKIPESWGTPPLDKPPQL